MQHADKKQREELDRALNDPPANVKPEVIAALPEWQDEAVGNQFLAGLAARGGAGRVAVQGVHNVAVEK